MQFDYAILHFVNSFAQTFPAFDSAMAVIADNQFAKGAVLIVFFWVWFSEKAAAKPYQAMLTAGILSPFIAFLLGRTLTHLLPFRMRPLVNPDLHWVQSGYIAPESWSHTWSSFPSDHAACFAGVAMTIFLVSRSAGLVAFLYVFLIIDFPRLYLGLHYPSDILGGTLIGVAVACIAASFPICEFIAFPFLRLKEQRPRVFYSGLFLVVFAIGSINSVNSLFVLARDLRAALTTELR
jgi:membrane-associated phospholipid phosphatase